MTTKQILFSAFLLGIINNTGLAMDKEDFRENFSKHKLLPPMQQKTKNNPTLYHTTNSNKEITCMISEEYIIFIKKFKKQDDGSCFSSESPFDEINEVLKNQSTQLMTTKELFSADTIGHFTSSDCYCNSLFIIKRQKENSD
jgi:hypothetical protein